MSLSCISHLVGHSILNDYVIALLKRDIDKQPKAASSLDDDACREGLLRRGSYKTKNCWMTIVG
jgi:hypothetical protein